MAAGALAAVGCFGHQPLFQDSFLAMDSVVGLSIVAARRSDAERGFRLARREVARLEAILSDYNPDSNVGRLNARRTTDLAPETKWLLLRAQQTCHETDGAFDVTMRPIKHAWGFGTGGTPHVPDSTTIDALLQHVGCDRFEITADGHLAWHDSLAMIDLGGIAQGFVAGSVADSLRAIGLPNFLIDVSGDIVSGGRRADGRPWRIGIQNPRRPDSLLARVDLDVVAVTTSGDYEQYFVADGVRYHHIFDPKTGWPARGAASVSVFSDDPVAADCMATAVFVMGPERGRAFLDRRQDLRGVIVQADSAGHVQSVWSDGMRPGAGH